MKARECRTVETLDKQKLREWLNAEQRKIVTRHNATEDDEERSTLLLVYSAYQSVMNGVNDGTFNTNSAN